MSSRWSAVISQLAALLALASLAGCFGSGKPAGAGGEAAGGVAVEETPEAPEAGKSAGGEPASVPEAGKTVAEAPKPTAPAGDQEFGPAPPKVSELYRIRTEDLLEIGVMGEDDMTKRIKVGPDGRISYFQATELMAAGRTLGELKDEIRAQMTKLFKHPEVYVSLIDSAGLFVTITGQVAKPGTYKINNETRLTDIIAQAGGIPLGVSLGGRYADTSEVADLSRAYLLRGDRFEPVDFAKLFGERDVVDPKEIVANNVRLVAHDRIFIPSAIKLDNKIYVLGQVRNPGLIQFSKEITFLEAIARAGDVPEAAWERKSFIIRGRLDKQPQIIEINSREVRTGKLSDVRLQAGDVVFVPKTPLAKAAEVSGQFGAVLGGMTAADNAYKREWGNKP